MTVIAMTREIGCRGTEVAAGLAARLGLRVVDSEIVTTGVASRLGVDESAVQRQLDGSASLIERMSINHRKLHRYTSEEILRLVEQDNVLIRGWGAATLLRDFPQVISVRICAPKEFRVKVVMERHGLAADADVEAVRAEIERYDAAYARTLHSFFGIEREHRLLYHISLNTDRVPVAACVNAIAQLAADPKFTDGDAAHSVLANRLAEVRINVALSEAIGIAVAPTGITAVVGDRSVTLAGTTTSVEASSRAEEIARQYAGGRTLDNRIAVAPPRGRNF